VIAGFDPLLWAAIFTGSGAMVGSLVGALSAIGPSFRRLSREGKSPSPTVDDVKAGSQVDAPSPTADMVQSPTDANDRLLDRRLVEVARAIKDASATTQEIADEVLASSIRGKLHFRGPEFAVFIVGGDFLRAGSSSQADISGLLKNRDSSLRPIPLGEDVRTVVRALFEVDVPRLAAERVEATPQAAEGADRRSGAEQSTP
jgi:hypothetical protein